MLKKKYEKPNSTTLVDRDENKAKEISLWVVSIVYDESVKG